MMGLSWRLTLLLLLCDAPVSLASAGDRSSEFQRCVRLCSKQCDLSKIPPLHQYLLWDCQDDCKYKCMHEISEAFKAQYNIVWKFYGHWPYKRILGLQEPAAALFSLGNMLPHFHNLVYNRDKLMRPGVRFGSHILIYSIVALSAWTASTMFHARKIEPLISFDYAFALLFISYGLWLGLSRLWWEFRGDKDIVLKRIFNLCFTVRVLWQVINTLDGSVYFQDHMTLSIGLSVAHAVTWLAFIAFSGSKSKLFCLFCQIWFGAASLLELFDFPPYHGIFDAHALWHAATIPLGFWWFQFWLQDAEYCARLSESQLEAAVNRAALSHNELNKNK